MNNPFDLTGKTILVTGASGGLGSQAAISISRMGGRVLLVGRNQDKLQAVRDRMVEVAAVPGVSDGAGAGHQIHGVDLADSSARSALAGILPPLDGISHCAGMTLLQPFKFVTESQYEEVYRINVEAPLFLTQRLLKNKRILPGASLVFVSSISPLAGFKGHSVYAGSKAAISAVSRVLAHELAPSRIRSNTISPGMVKTQVMDEYQRQMSAEFVAADDARYPLGYGEPEDVANAIIFFLSEASKWITGSNLVMDGGLT